MNPKGPLDVSQILCHDPWLAILLRRQKKEGRGLYLISLAPISL